MSAFNVNTNMRQPLCQHGEIAWWGHSCNIILVTWRYFCDAIGEYRAAYLCTVQLQYFSGIMHMAPSFSALACWRHQMETLSALLALCAVNSPFTGEFHAQRPVTRSLMFSLVCAWINGWLNKGEAGDSRRHRTIALWRQCNGNSLYYSCPFWQNAKC